jgi:hypothetical protein
MKLYEALLSFQPEKSELNGNQRDKMTNFFSTYGEFYSLYYANKDFKDDYIMTILKRYNFWRHLAKDR